MRGGKGWIEFHGGVRQQYEPPFNSLNPRYAACTDHRPACDCREAEWSEELNEYRLEWQGVQRAISDICGGHPGECMCTGCQIARRIHLSYLTALGVRS